MDKFTDKGISLLPAFCVTWMVYGAVTSVLLDVVACWRRTWLFPGRLGASEPVPHPLGAALSPPVAGFQAGVPVSCSPEQVPRARSRGRRAGKDGTSPTCGGNRMRRP